LKEMLFSKMAETKSCVDVGGGAFSADEFGLISPPLSNVTLYRPESAKAPSDIAI
jgi:hypothetical protein